MRDYDKAARIDTAFRIERDNLRQLRPIDRDQTELNLKAANSLNNFVLNMGMSTKARLYDLITCDDPHAL